MIKFVVPIVIIFLTVILYGSFLDITPVHFNQDELGFSLNAYSIAKTGYDENGRFLPLYFWHLGVMWSTPIIVYLTSFVLKLFPLTEATVRFASVFIGIMDVVLIFYLAKKLFKKQLYGIIAAALLALTPVHFIHSRLLLDNLYPVPFVLAWLLFLFIFLEQKKLWSLLLSSFFLGLGVHSYHAAKVLMPIYLTMTFLFLIPEIKKKKIIAPLILLAFILPILPLIPWLSQYPDTLTDQVRYTGLYNTNLSPIAGILSLITLENLLQKLGIYVSYFNLSFLFSTSDISLIHSTRTVGVFLLSLLILLPLGMVKIIKELGRRAGLLIITGFFVAPMAPSLVGNQFRVSKELVILPSAILLAVSGIRFLLNFRNKVGKVLAIILLAIIPLQFGLFISTYYGDYRNQSYTWFNYDIPGGLETVIGQSQQKPTDSIYLDNKVHFIDRYWKFYIIKNHSEDLISKTNYFDSQYLDLKSLPTNSLLLYRFDSINSQQSRINLTEKIREPDGFTSFYIYRN